MPSKTRNALSSEKGYTGLKRTILLLATGFITLIVIFSGISLHLQHRHATDDARKKVKHHSIAAGEHTARIIEGVDLALKQIADAFQSQWQPGEHHPKQIHLALAGVKSHLPQLRDIIILNRQGISVHDSGRYPAKQIDLSDRTYFTVHESNTVSGLYVGSPLKGRSSGKWFLAVSRAMVTPTQRFSGVVAAIVDPEYFWNYYNLLGQANGIQTLFYHKNGRIIAGSGGLTPDNAQLAGQSVAEQPFSALPSGKSETQKTPTPMKGRLLSGLGNQIGIVLPLARNDDRYANLDIAAFISEDMVLAGFRQNFISAGAFLLFSVLFAAGLIFISIRQIDARQKTREQLIRAIERKNAAEADVKKANHELQTLNRDLETRISDRTSDLEDALDNLKSLQHQIVEREKLASLGRLVAGIAHEINTPLGAAITATTALEEYIDDFTRKTEDLSHPEASLKDITGITEKLSYGTALIRSNILRAGDLTHSFKQVASDRQLDDFREIDLTTYMTDVVSSLSPEARRKGVSLEVHSPEATPLTTDPGALSQVMTNLIMNTLVHAFELPGDNRVRVTLETDETQVHLTVSDNGCGMPETVREKIFDPFYTTRRGAGGTGLGMHIVYTIVSGRLGGSVRVESAIGEGTRVSVTLPKTPPLPET
ncbi:MAG: ATP-binding protein [Desulfobacterales bacterium]|nr:ATP-binding protein [Desulfobacterales bacterium]